MSNIKTTEEKANFWDKIVEFSQPITQTGMKGSTSPVKINEYLQKYKILQVSEIKVDNKIEDICSELFRRNRNLVVALSNTSKGIITCFVGNKNKVYYMLGIERDKDNSEMFQSMIKGIFPGISMSEKNIEPLLEIFESNLEHQGFLFGIPKIEENTKKNNFNWNNIIRSLYGRNYIITVESKPYDDITERIRSLVELKDHVHKYQKINKSETEGKGENKQIAHGKFKSHSVSNSVSHGSFESKSFGASASYIVGVSMSKSSGTSTNISHGRTNTTGDSETVSYGDFKINQSSIGVEEQNSFAIEIEDLCNKEIQRIKTGINSGLWKTHINISAGDEISFEIIQKALIGEYTKKSSSWDKPDIMYYRNKTGEVLEANFNGNCFNYLNSEELSVLTTPPIESMPGYQISKCPEYGLTDLVDGRDSERIGVMCEFERILDGNYFYLSSEDLNKHVFVTGMTGAGKTTTVKQILRNNESPFMVIESVKTEYRNFLQEIGGSLKIFTIGKHTISPFKINPFYVQMGVPISTHIDYLKDLFNATFSLYGPMPYILEKCLSNIYLEKGWNLTQGIHPFQILKNNEFNAEAYKTKEHYYYFPTMSDLLNEVKTYVEKSEYKGEIRENIKSALLTRLSSLCVGSKGQIFNTTEVYPIERLLTENVIFELEALPADDDKAYFVGMMLIFLREFRNADISVTNPILKHLLVIEEAHRLLSNVSAEKNSEFFGNPKGKAVEAFCNIISEMRSLGQGIIVVEQIPSKLAKDVIKNTNTKIIHRLVAKDDQIALGNTIGINDSEAIYIGELKNGRVLCHKDGMAKPVQIQVEYYPDNLTKQDTFIYNHMNTLCDDKYLKNINNIILANEIINDIPSEVGVLVLKFINSILCCPPEDFIDLIKILKYEFMIVSNKKMKIFEQVTDEVMAYITADVSCRIFSHGMYNQKGRIPSNLFEDTYKLVLNCHKTEVNKYVEKMNKYYHDAGMSAKEYIVKLVSLLIKGLPQDKLCNRLSYIEILNECFLREGSVTQKSLLQEMGRN